jgi:hypothetical protein
MPSVQVTAGMLLGLVLACSDRASTRPPMAQQVQDFVDRVTSDLSQDGPAAWLRHFEDGPDFFMASDGRLIFPDRSVADTFVASLGTRIRTMELRFQHLRVDSLDANRALLAANFDEALTDTAGVALRFSGYLTAIAERQDAGWKLRNLHWSLLEHAPEH